MHLWGLPRAQAMLCPEESRGWRGLMHLSRFAQPAGSLGWASLSSLTPPGSHQTANQTVPVTGSLGAVLPGIPQPVSYRFAPSFPGAGLPVAP